MTYNANCSIPIPKTLPIQAPIAILGINRPAGTLDKQFMSKKNRKLIVVYYQQTLIPNVKIVINSLNKAARISCQTALVTP